MVVMNFSRSFRISRRIQPLGLLSQIFRPFVQTDNHFFIDRRPLS